MDTAVSRCGRWSLMVIRVGGIALLVGALGYRIGVLGFGVGFGLVGLGLLLSLVAGLLALVALVFGRRQRQTLRPARAALLVAMAVLAIPVWTIARGGDAPAIHHITTDPDDPPQFEAVIPLRGDSANSLDYTAEIAAIQREAYPDIQPIQLDMSPADAFEACLAVAQELGWEIVSTDSAAGRIEATDTTFWMGFKDDVVVRIRQVDSGSRIDLRSVSRVGGGDIGVNAARIRRFARRLSGG